MADLKLDKMSIKELKKLGKDVSKAIENYDGKKRQEAVAALDAKAREMGFTLSELTGGTARKKSASSPKYRHPENAAMTWTGRGRQPGWIREAVENGQSLDDFLIDKPA